MIQHNKNKILYSNLLFEKIELKDMKKSQEYQKPVNNSHFSHTIPSNLPYNIKIKH